MKILIQEFEEEPSLDKDGSLLRKEYTIDDRNIDAKPTFSASSTAHTNKHSFSGASSPSSLWQSISRVWTQLFLPIGYPHSVDDSYLRYQLYDGLQGLCSYWRGVVSTKAVLEATGVGNADATATSAALQWALRDGMGMIGGLIFSYFCSHQFDIYVKEFRLFADVINDVALTLDMLAPYFGTSGSLWILSASTLCKTMCGMSAGATKGRITQHFARTNGNMADLTAKESTQETLVSLLGMMGGVWVARILEHAPMSLTWLVFGFLTVLHVWANYKGVLQLKLATINPERARVLFQRLVDTVANDDGNAIGKTTRFKELLPTPEQVNESLWCSTRHLVFPTLHANDPIDPKKLEVLSEFMQQNYVLGVDRRRRHVYAWLRVGAGYIDELQAYFHALVLQECLSRGDTWNSTLIQRTLRNVQHVFPAKSEQILLQELDGKKEARAKSSQGLLHALEEKGWDMQSRLYLGFSQGRLKWLAKAE